jgi:hypothetical protein
MKSTVTREFGVGQNYQVSRSFLGATQVCHEIIHVPQSL